MATVDELPGLAAEDAQVTAEPVPEAPLIEAPAVEAPVAEAPAPEPAEAAQAAPEPAVKPIIVGSEAAPAAKKTGWWRR